MNECPPLNGFGHLSHSGLRVTHGGVGVSVTPSCAPARALVWP